MFRGNNKDARTTSMMPLLLTLNGFVNPFSFEQVNSVDRNTNRRLLSQSAPSWMLQQP